MNTEKRREIGTRVLGTPWRVRQGACIAGVSRRSFVSVLCYLMLIVLGMSTSSCIWELGDIFKGKQRQEGVAELYLRLPTTFTSTRSLAVTSADENQLSEVTVLAFRKGSDDEYELAYVWDDNEFERAAAGSDYTVKTKVVFNPKEIASDDFFDFWVLANVPIERTAGLPLGVSKSSALESLLYSESDGVTQLGSEFVPIPLWGQSLDVQLVASGITDESKSRIDLIRSVAKINVVLTDVNASVVELREVYYYNRWLSGLAAPAQLHVFENKEVTAPTLPGVFTDPIGADWNAFYEVPESPEGEGVYIKLENAIYAFETRGGEVPTTTPVTEPCLILGAHYDGDPELTYYRVDFLRYDALGEYTEESYAPVLRDKLYTVSPVEITKSGWPTREEALYNDPLGATVTVIPWLTEYIDVPLK